MSAVRHSLASDIQTDEYLRQRLAPRPGDRFYLHLADLRLALERLRTDLPLEILDYGAGGSPYRSLFPNARYRRADFLQSEADQLDYVLDEHSRVGERAATFDLIISTQVAEHVVDPARYFAECYRLLKPGGMLYCTTHGVFEDHGCPYDFQRWTADGLRRDLTNAGFTIDRLEKHTTGPRALLFQLDYHLALLVAPRRSLLGMALWLVRSFMVRFRDRIHRQCDRYFDHCRVVAEALDRHAVYIGVAALARKPAAE
jgi:SAM-dependent methyltransferase